MDEKIRKPQVRFEGFEDDWEQRKLEDLVIQHNAGVYINKEDYGAGINVIGVGNIYDNDIFNGEIYRLGPVTESKFLLEENDLIYGESSLVPEGIARTVCVGKDGAGSAFAWHTRRVKLDQNFVNSHFATLELNYNFEVRKYLMAVSTQTALTGMTTEGYFGTTLILPKVEEQEKISRVFKQLDNLITLHQRKYDKLQNVKKSMLEKMFPKNGMKVPEIRFEGFTDDWEQRKLFDVIIDIADGPFGSNLKTEHYTDKKEARIIQLSNLSDYGWQEENTRYTTFEHAKKIKRCIVNKGELVIGKMMPAGMTIMCPNAEKMYVLSSDCVRVKLDNQRMTNEFFLYTTKSLAFLNQVNNDSQGSTRVRTSISKIRTMDFSIPSIEEQIKIGEYFKELDHLITLHQRKLFKLQQLKTIFLEKLLP